MSTALIITFFFMTFLFIGFKSRHWKQRNSVEKECECALHYEQLKQDIKDAREESLAYLETQVDEFKQDFWGRVDNNHLNELASQLYADISSKWAGCSYA